jgi:hypothetical protein
MISIQVNVSRSAKRIRHISKKMIPALVHLKDHFSILQPKTVQFLLAPTELNGIKNSEDVFSLKRNARSGKHGALTMENALICAL